MCRPDSIGRVGRAALAALVLLAACTRKETPSPPSPPPLPAAAQREADAGVDAARGAPEAEAGDASTDASLGTLSTANETDFAGAPKTARSIGHTSVVFKVELANGKKAVFKPSSRRGPARYKGEIAAYRLGTALGIDNVPPAYFRTFDARALAAAMSNEASSELFAKEAIVSAGVVKGALIPWIDGLDFVALEKAPLSGQWKAWLAKDGAIPDADRARAREISQLVLFDYLTANWDRWSGGNVGLDPRTKRLLFIDNDGAFFEVPPDDGLARNEKLASGVHKLSKSLVTAIEALDARALEKALGEESPGVPLLSRKAVAGVIARREKLLGLVRTQEKDVAAFP